MRLKKYIITAAVLMTALMFSKNAYASETKLKGMDAMEITTKMGKGWNLGNTFDATGGNRSDVYSQEQSWGNPKVTKELIDGVKAAGFDTIRIPVTWYRHVTPGENYKIDEDFLARVKEVVDYAYEDGLFIIINVHHEEWVNDKDIDKNYVKIGEELTSVWNQISEYFKDYDEHLIFEGMNEPRAAGTGYEWEGTPECYDAVNYLNSLFVNTVRKSGGNNLERALMIPGYAASSSSRVLKSIVIPEFEGSQAQNIIISVHCYSPYEFCLQDTKVDFNPNSTSDTADITRLMSDLDRLFISNGIPVVIGECGATNSHDNNGARKAWFAFFGKATKDHNIPAIVWDNGAKGNSGGECHNYFERKTGEMYSPDLIKAFIMGSVETEEVTVMTYDFEPKTIGDTAVISVPSDNGFLPKSLTQKAKINHTEGAPVGFSLVVSGKDGNAPYASWDVSRFTGKNVKVTCYISSDSECSVTLGVEDTDEKDIVTANVDSAWTKVVFSNRFLETESEKKVFFKSDSDFYVDDISVEIIGDDEEEFAIEKEGGNGEPSESEESSSVEVDETANEKTNVNGENEKTAEENSKGIGPKVGVIAAVLLAVGCAFFFRKKK